MSSSFKKYQGTNTSDATAVVTDILSPKTAYGSAGTKLTGTLALTGNAVVGEVLSGKTFYKDNPVSQLTGTMTNVGAQSITPVAAGNTITAGYHSGSGSVVADADFTAANIKTGVVIWGITGTAEGAPTLDADASVTDSTHTIYYRKFGKMYLIRGIYVSHVGQVLVPQNQLNTASRIATKLGITASAYIIGANNYNFTHAYYGSQWEFESNTNAGGVVVGILST